MRKSFLFASVLALTLQALPASAAGMWQGLYFEGRVGIPVPLDQEVFVSAVGNGDYDPDGGIAFGISVGRYLRSNVRAEIELSYIHAADGDLTFAGGGAALPFTGDATVIAVLFNVFYEFDVDWRMRPFVGVGVGLAHFDLDGFGAVGSAVLVNDSDTTFAAAFHAGVDVPIREGYTGTVRYTLGYTSEADFATTVPAITSSKDGGIDHFIGFGIRVDLD